MIKRSFDLVAALVGLVAAATILLVLVILIRLESKGPAVFAQTRVGKDQEPFTCYKLRSMFSETGDHASHLVPEASVTRIGRFLRRTKLDEVPQLLNVARGDMSLVGPRPCLPNQTELIAERARHGVFDVRPGITGLAQMQGIDMSDPARLAEVDGGYVASQTFAGDVAILLATFTGRGMNVDRVGTT